MLSSKLEKCTGKNTPQRGREILFLKGTSPGPELYLPLASGISWHKFAPLSSCSRTSVWQACTVCVPVCFTSKSCGLLLQAALSVQFPNDVNVRSSNRPCSSRGWRDCVGKPFPSHEGCYKREVSMAALVFRFPHFL